MAVSAERFAREMRSFDQRRAIVKAMRRALNRQARPALREVRAHAREILPSSGGLGMWVARSSLTFQIRYTGRSAGIRLRGRRKSTKGRSDLDRIDRGEVRHPSWGRRFRGSWHAQAVTPGWWSEPLQNDTTIGAAVDHEVDRALDEIRRG